MTQSSLQQIMNDVARRIDKIQPAMQKEQAARARSPLTLIEAYAAQDPVLAELHKDYLDARARAGELVRLRGEDDPMAEVAADMLDSVHSAIQTRMLELREDRKLRLRAIRALKAARTSGQRDRDLASRQYRQKMSEFYRRQQQQKSRMDARAKGEDSFWALMVMLSLLQQMTARTQRALSAASAFALASAGEPGPDEAQPCAA